MLSLKQKKKSDRIKHDKTMMEIAIDVHLSFSKVGQIMREYLPLPVEVNHFNHDPIIKLFNSLKIPHFRPESIINSARIDVSLGVR